MPLLDRLTQDRLSVFLTDKATGGAAAQVPVYGELTLHEETLPWRMSRMHLGELARNETITSPAFLDLVMDAIPARMEEAAFRALDQLTLAALGDEMAAQLAGIAKADQATRREAVSKALEQALEVLGLAPELPVLTATIRRIPLGFLATDHAGYASFDLSRAKSAVAAGIPGKAKRGIGVHLLPLGNDALRVDVLEQGRFMHDAIVGKLEFLRPLGEGALAPPGMPSLQRPGLADWFLSPGSFASNPAKLLGENGCENLYPGQLALQEFVLRQIVRLSEPPRGTVVPPGHKAGYLDEYRVVWQPLGHSLGEILYSLPLAPGETVKLAVIDWSWQSEAARGEQTTLDEAVLHRTHRDRLITETVAAGVKELQSGDSFMAGFAGTVGLSAGLGAASVAAGSAFSLGGAVSSSEGSRNLAAENVQRISDSFAQASSARRSLNSTVVVQARQEEKQAIQTRSFTNHNRGHTLTVLYYEVLRHYRMTVEWVRRRPVLLRPLPASVPALAREAPANTVTSLDKALLEHRNLLEDVLMDPAARAGFDALEKVSAWSAEYERAGRVPPDTAMQAPRPFSEGDIGFSMFEFVLRSAEENAMLTPDKVVIRAMRRDGVAIALDFLYTGPRSDKSLDHSPENINSGRRFSVMSGNQYILVRPRADAAGKPVFVLWRDLAGFQIEKWGDEDWRIIRLGVRGFALGPEAVDLIPEGDVYLELVAKEPSAQAVMWVRRPAPDLPPPPPELPPMQRLSGEEFRALQRLRTHVAANAPAYRRILTLSRPAESYAVEFETAVWSGTTMLADKVMPTPLEVSGNYVAFPYIEDAPQADAIAEIAVLIRSDDPAKRQEGMDRLSRLTDADLNQTLTRIALSATRSERLVSLPTRGVFAEGKLGHCSVAEEIDETRFWRWDEHPLAVNAPDIAPVTPITPQPQATNLAPTPFPQPVVTVVAPSAAPDPTGLAAALALLGRPDIFRDMSGRQEVAGLLKGLSDNSLGAIEAAQRAREIQQKYGADLSGLDRPAQPAGGAPPPAQAPARETPPLTPNVEQRQAARLENEDRKLDIAKRLPPDQARPIRQSVSNEVSRPVRFVRVVLSSEWAGETIKQPMTATFAGETWAASGENAMLQAARGSANVEWICELRFPPSRVRIAVTDPVPLDASLSVEVPGLAVDGLQLVAKTYEVPLQAQATQSFRLEHTLLGLRADDKTTEIQLRGVAKIGRRQIEATVEVNAAGELLFDMTRGLQAEGTVEKVIKLVRSATLKGAVKTTLGGKAAIKGTFEVLYVVGYELTQAG